MQSDDEMERWRGAYAERWRGGEMKGWRDRKEKYREARRAW
jgi:hypothetical protein